MKISIFKSIVPILFILFVNCCNTFKTNEISKEKVAGKAFYIDNIKGNDRSRGTAERPLKSIKELNRRLQRGSENICFAGGQVFKGTLLLSGVDRSPDNPLIVTSYGEGKATINGDVSEAILIRKCQNIRIVNLNLKGNGRTNGNRTNGLSISQSSRCKIDDVSISGFQKSGLDLYDCTYSDVTGVTAIENGFSGINIMGSERHLSRNILIRDCRAENNPGDPSNLDNHSGNGILVGVSDSVMIDHCSATNNGWDMPRQGNGPVGIWAWESDHVVIQYCISYRNKTSRNAKDGGGFDLDGGVTNSLIQYCLSYENQGAGYGLFQYAGASDWSDNTIRYCISINDGQTTEGSGGIFIWNGSNDTLQMERCNVYNNVVYNTGAPLISYENASAHKNFIFCDNIFIGDDQMITGFNGGSRFLGNDWWNNSGSLRFLNYSDLAHWARETGQEMMNGRFVGMQLGPDFTGPLTTDITDPYNLKKLAGYTLKPASPLKNKGLDVSSIFGIDRPLYDFFGNSVAAGYASEPGVYEMN